MWRTLGNVHYFDSFWTGVSKCDGQISAYVHPGRIDECYGYVVLVSDWERQRCNDVFAFYIKDHFANPFPASDREYPHWIWQFASETVENHELGRWEEVGNLCVFFPAEWEPTELLLPNDKKVEWQLLPMAIEDFVCSRCNREAYVNGYGVVVYDSSDCYVIYYTLREPMARTFEFNDVLEREREAAEYLLGKDGARALFDAAMERLHNEFHVNYKVCVPCWW